MNALSAYEEIRISQNVITMKLITLATLIVAIFGCFSCEPTFEYFEVFVIPEGKHEGNHKVQMLQDTQLKFSAIFDSSAIYTALTEENQWDTHKLMGFADCNSHHHENSARFGWRWVENHLEIMAYCYANGERIIEKVGNISLNTKNDFTIELQDDAYYFILNNETPVSIVRSRPCTKGAYYMLFPYFGGNEVAPHDVTIRIKQNY